MKKILIASIFMFSYSLSANAEQNFTLQVNPQAQGVERTTTRPQSGSNDGALSTFCGAVFDGVSQTSRTTRSGARGILTGGAAGFDPYLVEIEGIRYMIIKDNKDGQFNQNDILGITDTISNVFASLKPLDEDRDFKLTGKELKKAGIRLVRVNEQGKLEYKDKSQDFKNEDVIFIYLTELRKAYKNNGATGDFGYYDVVVKNDKGEKKLVTGVVTFETNEQLQNYF